MIPRNTRASLLATTLITTLATPVLAQSNADAEQTDLFTYLGRIVFGAGAPKVAIEVPQAVTVLEEGDFNREQPDTIGDVIEAAPGVSTVGSESRFGESINIRGIGAGTSADEPRIVTLIDGVKKYYESYRQGSLFTDPEFFKDVEILRGPSSSTLYGSGAIGGVVAFETKDAADIITEEGDTFAIKQQLEFKSNGDGKESSTFLAFAPDQQFDALIGFIYDDSDFMEDGAGNTIFGTAITETNILAKGTYSFGDDLEHSIEGGVIYYRGKADDQLLDVIDNAAVFGTVDRTVTDTTAFAKYGYAPLDNPFIDLEVQLSYAKSENAVTDFSSIFTVFDADYAYEGLGVRAVNTIERTGEVTDNFLTFGVEAYERERISVRATAGNAAFQPTGKTKAIGIFAQNEWVANDTLTIITGARLDYQKTSPTGLVPTTVEDSGTAISANLAMHHQTTDKLAFFGSVSYTERLPVVDELYDTRVTAGPDQPAAGTLDPERSLNFELGASHVSSDVFTQGDELAFKGTVFHHNVSDLIARNNFGAAGDPTFINFDEVEFTGFELEGAYESELAFASLALTIMDGKNVSNPAANNPNLEDRIPADTLRLSLGRRIPSRNLEFGWTGTFYKSKSRVAAAGGGATTTINTPSDLIHDVYASWTPDEGALQGAELRLGVSNVFDEDYRTHLQSTGIRRAGRSFNLTLTKTF